MNRNSLCSTVRWRFSSDDARCKLRKLYPSYLLISNLVDYYKSAIEIVGGEQFILSAVTHADEHNRAMSEALGRDVYHYRLHVVYIPVVKKQILWSKRCKDKSLVGTVKETITQVSSSKKWKSHPAMDEQGKPILQKNGKPVLRKSYSVLQDDFYNAMRAPMWSGVSVAVQKNI